MKPLHTFAEKKESQLSLYWLDENFQQALSRCDELESRIKALTSMVVDQAGIILELQAKVKQLGTVDIIADRVLAKLTEKPKAKKK